MMNDETIRIIILGDKKVGKTTIIQSFMQNGGRLTGGDWWEKRVKLDTDGSVITVRIRDCNIKQPPSTLSSNYFQDMDGCVFVFSTLDAESFRNLDEWYTAFSDCRHYSTSIPVAFAENKVDQIERTVLDQNEVNRTAKAHRLRLYRTSAAAHLNVYDMFMYLINKIHTNTHHPNSNNDRSASRSNSIVSGQTEDTDERDGDEEGSNDDEDDKGDEVRPAKQRTGGVKPTFNRHDKNCTIS